MVDMLSRARYDDEDGMVSEDEEVGVDFFEAAHLTTERVSTPMLNKFDESEYDREWLLIGSVKVDVCGSCYDERRMERRLVDV
jgi:sulfur relay (sulfurtransferase) complex TusBCD TusD component (DsrE family)